MSVAIAFSVGLLTAPVNAQEVIKRCAGVGVRSIDISYELVQNIPIGAKQETIETGLLAADTKAIMVVVRGPVLGSMDSSNLSTDLACTRDGFALTAAITRSANYHGAVRQNVLWRPVITLRVGLDSPKVVFESIWKMELSNGKKVDRARTPPYPEQEYPITLTKTVYPVSK